MNHAASLTIASLYGFAGRNDGPDGRPGKIAVRPHLILGVEPRIWSFVFGAAGLSDMRGWRQAIMIDCGKRVIDELRADSVDTPRTTCLFFSHSSRPAEGQAL